MSGGDEQNFADKYLQELAQAAVTVFRQITEIAQADLRIYPEEDDFGDMLAVLTEVEKRLGENPALIMAEFLRTSQQDSLPEFKKRLGEDKDSTEQALVNAVRHLLNECIKRAWEFYPEGGYLKPYDPDS